MDNPNNRSPHSAIFTITRSARLACEKEGKMYKTICLVLAVICFGIGAISKVAPGDINWTNAGLCFVTLSLIVG